MAILKVSCGVIAGGSGIRTTLVTTFGWALALGKGCDTGSSVSASSPGDGSGGGGGAVGRGTTLILGLFLLPGGLPRPLLGSGAGGSGAGGSGEGGSGAGGSGAGDSSGTTVSVSIYWPQYLYCQVMNVN